MADGSVGAVGVVGGGPHRGLSKELLAHDFRPHAYPVCVSPVSPLAKLTTEMVS